MCQIYHEDVMQMMVLVMFFDKKNCWHPRRSSINHVFLFFSCSMGACRNDVRLTGFENLLKTYIMSGLWESRRAFMSNRWPFSFLNDEQMSNKVGVEQQPAAYCARTIYIYIWTCHDSPEPKTELPPLFC